MKASLLMLTLAAMALPALGEVTLYGREGFEGRSLTTREPLRNLEREGFANRASSAVVRGGPYEFCDDRGFEGRCVVLGPGRYPTLAAMGMNDAIVSLRPAAAAPVPVPPPAPARITLFGREGFEGMSFATQEPVRHLERHDFNDRASSVIVEGGPFEICDGRGFEGRCLVLRPGRYPSLVAMGMNDAITSVRPVAVAPPAPVPPPVVVPPPVAQITLFGREGFEGRSFATGDPVRNLERHDFNDRASSAIVEGGPFEICDELGFEGRCRILRPGQYPSLAAMGMNDAISSVRPVDRHAQSEERRFAPPPPVAYDYRPRADERLFDAQVVAVRAVYGQPEQRCWVERENVPAGDPGRAIAGAIIGGILGHQVGSGRGNDAATAAGAVAGAAIGSNYGGTTYSRDVERCTRSQVSGPPLYWDVTYRFRGVDRYVQMTRPPGPTITVNRDGEPRAG